MLCYFTTQTVNPDPDPTVRDETQDVVTTVPEVTVQRPTGSAPKSSRTDLPTHDVDQHERDVLPWLQSNTLNDESDGMR